MFLAFINFLTAVTTFCNPAKSSAKLIPAKSSSLMFLIALVNCSPVLVSFFDNTLVSR